MRLRVRSDDALLPWSHGHREERVKVWWDSRPTGRAQLADTVRLLTGDQRIDASHSALPIPQSAFQISLSRSNFRRRNDSAPTVASVVRRQKSYDGFLPAEPR